MYTQAVDVNKMIKVFISHVTSLQEKNDWRSKKKQVTEVSVKKRQPVQNRQPAKKKDIAMDIGLEIAMGMDIAFGFFLP